MNARALLGALVVWLAGSGAPLFAEEQQFPESIGTGIVVEADPAAGTMIIEGYRYRAPPGVLVQVGGVTGTVADLLPGMQVQFRFLRIPDDLRELVEVRQIPPGVEIQRL
jgi:hypothetical protein